MRPSRRRRYAYRTCRFEPVEPRWFLSAGTVPDFYLDYFVENQLYDEIHAALADAHELTGLAQARAEYGLSGHGQTVAVIDSGIAYDHVALGGGFGSGYRVVGGFDFTAERDADPYDDGPYGSHGTHVAGIIGSGDSRSPGVAPGVELVGLRVFDDYGSGYFSWVEEALQWVHEHRHDFEHPITAVNLSIGSRSNLDGPPPWAMLEEELAQLEADGIFISVAAGNGFQAYEEPGLAYPAASPHVVPVASLDDDGSLSFFSQRAERIIAAPGRGVRSSVPDYVGNRNGIDDDFAHYSGTSMAAPYVAGASVLLREAYEFAGLSDVSQQTIYNLMLDTAEVVYDPETAASYRRLNLERAVSSVMPADEFGSSQAAAYDLGTIADSRSLTGTIGSLSDSDWFSFTAGASGLVTAEVSATGDLLPQWELAGAARTTTTAGGEALAFRAVAGQTYAVGLATGSGIGHYTLDLSLEPDAGYVDWGTVLQQEFQDNRIDADGQWFTVTAAADGILTVEACFDHAQGDVDLKLFDAGRELAGASYGTADSERIDVTASAGDVFCLHAYTYGGGVNEDVDFRVTNLVSQSGSTVRVSGTEGDDSFTFAAGATHQITVNGVVYRFESAVVNVVTFDAVDGSDTALLTGTDGDDYALLCAGRAELRGFGYHVLAGSVETVTVRAGGGANQAVFCDSAGDDTFVAGARVARLSGDGFTNQGEGFQAVRAWAIAGGSDVAFIYDSPGNDTFGATPSCAVMYGEGYYNRVDLFEQVHAYATAGGFDVAKLFDSPGDDRFLANPTFGALYGGNFLSRAKFFEQVHAYAVSGGTDVATMYDSPGDDYFLMTQDFGALYGAGFCNRAKFFEEIYAHADAGGNDRAYLYDSPDDDFLRASDGWAWLLGGSSSAWLYGFEHVRAQATNGGTNRAEVTATDYVLQIEGDWV